MAKKKIVTRWGSQLQSEPVRPGIYALADGTGFLVRGRSGAKGKSFTRVLRGVTLAQAQRSRDELREPTAPTTESLSSMPLFATFAASLFEEKVNREVLSSAATVENWEGILRMYLIPAFGSKPVDEIVRQDVEVWMARVAAAVQNGKPRGTLDGPGPLAPLAARTANGWLRVLGTIMNEAVVRLDLPRNPMRGVKPLPEERAYTRESPNRVRLGDLPGALAVIRGEFPELYAMTMLGFLLGVRPSHMRPLRRQGPESDVKWEEGILLIRRSSARAQIISNRTKTEQDQEIALPPKMLEILRWHVETQIVTEEQKSSEFLFPARRGEMQAQSCLTRPFARMAKELGYKVTPRAARRTFQNSARDVGMHDTVTRSISGHATEEMQRHYSTAEFEEQRAGLAKILDVMLTKEGG